MQTPQIVLNNSTRLNYSYILVACVWLSRSSTSGQECDRGVVDSMECERFLMKIFSFFGEQDEINSVTSDDGGRIDMDGYLGATSSDVTFAPILQLYFHTETCWMCVHSCVFLCTSLCSTSSNCIPKQLLWSPPSQQVHKSSVQTSKFIELRSGLSHLHPH